MDTKGNKAVKKCGGRIEIKSVVVYFHIPKSLVVLALLREFPIIFQDFLEILEEFLEEYQRSLEEFLGILGEVLDRKSVV